MPNNDYVKREDIFPAVTEIAKEIVFGNQDDDKVVDIINSIPAADLEPKRYAEWISPDGISVCSECGKAAPYDVEGGVIVYWPNLNFCPNCGRRMNVEGKYAEIH